MGIFRRFGGNTTEPQVPTASKDTVREENNPARNKEGIVTIEYGTGYPIDVIYAYIRKDYSSKGYDDAMVNPDASYLEMGRQLIKNELKSLFDQISVRYKDEIKQLETMIRINETMGLTDTAMHLQTQKDIYTRHLSEIEEMRKGLESGSQQLQLMIGSYEKGFKTGIAAKSVELLNNLTNHKTLNSHE